MSRPVRGEIPAEVSGFFDNMKNQFPGVRRPLALIDNHICGPSALASAVWGGVSAGARRE